MSLSPLLLRTEFLLLSLSDKSTVDVVGNMDMDYATGSFCSSCSIPPPAAGGTLDFGVLEWGVLCALTTTTMGGKW